MKALVKRRLPLSGHLALLVACAVVPVLIFSVFLVARVSTQERAREERAMLDLSRALAAALDREMLINVGVLELLAQSPHLGTGDLAQFHAEARRVLASRPEWQSIIVASPDGQVLLNTGQPFGTPLGAVNEPESLREVVRTRQPVVGNLATGRIRGQLAFPVRVPIIRDRAVVQVLTAAVRPETLQDLLQAVPAREEWTRAFGDRNGVVAARSSDAQRFVGQRATPEFVSRITSRPEDFYRDTAADGAKTYVVFSRAAFSHWTAGMTFPAAVIDGPVRRSLALTVATGLALVAVTAMAAFLVGRRIARPIRAATEAAQALTRGESRPVAHSAVREVAELGESIDRSAALLREREGERNELLAAARAARGEAEAANRAKDEFLATLSHELRTPLNAMMGWVRLLRSGRLPPDRAEHAMEVIDRNTGLQAQLINDLLDVSRIIAGKLRVERRPTDVRIAVHEAVEQVRHVAEDKGVALEMAMPREPVTVDGDHARLVQVVANLLSNAVKFTPSKGRVVVDVSDGPEGVTIAVIDSGVGIAADDLPHVFERFRQAEAGASVRGLGLGLAIVRNIIELHGGRVDVFSDGVGRGARFVVTVPKAVAPAASLPRIDAPAGVQPRVGLRVLVVEDEDDNREMLEMLLKAHGMVVISAASGHEALARWKREAFDVLVSDLRMAGLDGYGLIEEIRRREGPGTRLRAVAVSANAAQQDKERAVAAGFDRHVSKPIDPDDLLSALA